MAIESFLRNSKIPVMVRIHGAGPENTKYFKEALPKMNEALLNCKSKYLSVIASYYFGFFQDYWNDYNHFSKEYSIQVDIRKQ